MTSIGEQRVCHANITHVDLPFAFDGKQCTVSALKTCYGDFVTQATHYAMLLTGKDEVAAYQHFNKVCKRCPKLHHGNINLNDHLQDLNQQLSLKHGNVVYLTYAGAKMFSQESNNVYAKENKEAILALLKAGYAALRATTTVDTSQPYGGIKKARNDDGAAAAAAAGADDDATTAVVAIRQHHDELQLVLPLVRAKNTEELLHIQNVNAEMQKREAAQLQHKEAMLAGELADIQRIKDLNAVMEKREEAVLQHEDKVIAQQERRLRMQMTMDRLQLHEQRLASDPAYAEAAQRLAEAGETLRRSDAAEALRLADAAEARRLAETADAVDAAAKKQANTERSRKSTETRRRHKLTETRRSRLQQYAAAKTAAERLLLEPELHSLLRDEYPNEVSRSHYLRSLAMASSAALEAVYVIELEGLPYSLYVGTSRNIETRIAHHRLGTGAECTKGATGVSRIPTCTAPIDDDIDGSERRETLHHMYTKGVENVRGWRYCSITLSRAQRKEAIENVCAWKKLCIKCGSNAHFVAQCDEHEDRRAAWMGAA